MRRAFPRGVTFEHRNILIDCGCAFIFYSAVVNTYVLCLGGIYYESRLGNR